MARRLCGDGHQVVGIDNLNDYYTVSLKEARLALLTPLPGFRFERTDLADRAAMASLFAREQFDRVIHLGAQAGVRYSWTTPSPMPTATSPATSPCWRGVARPGCST